jgi:hypothetical protein
MINYTSDLSGYCTIGKAERWTSLMRRALVWVSGQFTIFVSSVAEQVPGLGAFLTPGSGIRDG